MAELQQSEPAEEDGSLEQIPNGEFVQLFTKSQRRLFLFILAQVSHPADAEEILQDTNVIIWSKFHQFQLGTSFFAWAGKIATYEILKYREKKRAGRLQFSDEFISRVADEAIEMSDELEQRREVTVPLSDISAGKYLDRFGAPSINVAEQSALDLIVDGSSEESGVEVKLSESARRRSVKK